MHRNNISINYSHVISLSNLCKNAVSSRQARLRSRSHGVSQRDQDLRYSKTSSDLPDGHVPVPEHPIDDRETVRPVLVLPVDRVALLEIPLHWKSLNDLFACDELAVRDWGDLGVWQLISQSHTPPLGVSPKMSR